MDNQLGESLTTRRLRTVMKSKGMIEHSGWRDPATIEPSRLASMLACGKCLGSPLASIWEDSNWTLLTNREIVSFDSVEMRSISLVDIARTVVFPNHPPDSPEYKVGGSWLLVGPNQIPIWAPPWKPISSLLGVLRICPFDGMVEEDWRA